MTENEFQVKIQNELMNTDNAIKTFLMMGRSQGN